MFYRKNSRRILSAFLLSFLLFNVFGFGLNQISAAAENIKETIAKEIPTPNISPNIGNGGGGGHIVPSIPSFTYLGLEVVTNPAAIRDTDWTKVYGSLASGFVLNTDPKEKAYYLRLTKDTDTNIELARGVYTFVLASYPDAFAAYLGDDSVQYPYPTPDRFAPVFHLYADGQGSLIMLNGPDRKPNWRLNSDLPVGEYKYQGKVTSINGVQSDDIYLRLNIGRDASVPANQAPIAKDDVYATKQNTKLVIAPKSILDNDTDPDGAINPSNKENFSAVVETWPKHGELIMGKPSGQFSYVPEKDFIGKDIFTYKAFDGQALSNLATVTITVAGNNNQAPQVANDAYSVTSGNQLTVEVASGVLVNDIDTDGPLDMAAVLAANVSHGTLALASNGSFIYQANGGFIGEDAFTYRAFDGLAYSPIATSTITVNAPSGGGSNGGGNSSGSSSRQPNNASILINNNAVATNNLVVTLTLSANNMISQYAPLEMKVGNFSDLSSVAWRPYSTTTAWTLLNGIGQKTVYAQFRNSRGTSAVVNDSINYTTGQVLGDRDCSNTAGTLIAKKNTKDAAVYYIAADCKKYVFPDPKTYYTWYENFNTVRKVEVSELDLYPNGGVIAYRPGTKLVTHPETQKVYTVEANGALRYIPNSDTARNLYGDKWTSLVQDVIVGYFFTSYNSDGEVMDAKLPNGTLVKARNSDTIYYLENGQKRPFSSTYSFERNYFRYKNVITKDNLDNYPTGAIIEEPSSILSPYRIAY